MRINRIYYFFILLFKENFRRRITILLLLLIPALFYFIAINTTTTVPMLIKLATAPDEHVIIVNPRELGLIYIGLAATGFIASFLGLNLMQRNTLARKRLILCGYNPLELSLSKLGLLLCIVIILGIYTAFLGFLLMSPKHVPGVILGYILCGFIYGSFGLFIGAIVFRELEGILFIVLLANLDIGWLQNPIFYAAAPNKHIIRLLPGFDPSQIAVLSAFTDFDIGMQVVNSIVYGLVFLILSMIIFGINMRTYYKPVTNIVKEGT